MQKDIDRHNKLNARILELLNTLTEQGILSGHTTAELTQALNDNVTASSQTTNQLLTDLINNSGANNKPILELIKKVHEANLINKDVVDAFIKKDTEIVPMGISDIGSKTITF